MNATHNFLRVFFIILSVLFITTYTTTVYPGTYDLLSGLIGVTAGIGVGVLLIIFEQGLARLNLRYLNLALIGLFIGYLLGGLVLTILEAAIGLSGIPFIGEGWVLIKVCTYLSTSYLGMMLALKASDEFHLTIPFVRFNSMTRKKRDILLDKSVLADSRIIDLGTSGILDNQLVVPRFMVKELYRNMESGEEGQKGEARRALEVLKKLEELPSLKLRYLENDFPEVKDSLDKLIRLAKIEEANIIATDIDSIKQSTIESSDGVKVINLNQLSKALKPLSQTGEYMDIKIQRYGKEQGQGVGYLEDGTMVVVNGGADFIGQTIRCQVLSVKHTSSGRMIFCNALDEEEQERESAGSHPSHRNYYANPAVHT